MLIYISMLGILALVNWKKIDKSKYIRRFNTF